MCISVIHTALGNVKLNEIAERINTRPRKTLDLATPKEVYYDMLKSITQSNDVALDV